MIVFARTVFLTFAVLFTAAAFVPAYAQGLDLSRNNSKQPIEVTAEDGIEWNQPISQLIARKNATATRGNTSLKADTLRAHYRKSDEGDVDFWRLEAQGNVVLKSARETALGTHADYNVDKAIMVLKGKPAKLVTPTETVTATESIEYWQAKKMAVARGNATIKKGDKSLKAKTLTAYFKDGGKGAFELERVVAFSNVIIQTTKEKILADKGEYDVKSSTASLMGDVRIIQGNNTLKGDFATVNLDTGISRLTTSPENAKKGARVKGIFTPVDENGM